MTLSRRGILASLAAFPLTAEGLAAAAQAALPGVCVVTPESTEGPFYFDPRLERRDITEGRAGLKLKLGLTLLDARDCTPLPARRIDIWHCDAVGFYSGYDGQGEDRSMSTKHQTFLRGSQFTGADGGAEFDTIYPGWYSGRTTHIHLKAFIERNSVLTTQIYFPDDVTRRIYEAVAPYNARKGERDTDNRNDGVLRGSGAGEESVCALNENNGSYLATLVIAARL